MAPATRSGWRSVAVLMIVCSCVPARYATRDARVRVSLQAWNSTPETTHTRILLDERVLLDDTLPGERSDGRTGVTTVRIGPSAQVPPGTHRLRVLVGAGDLQRDTVVRIRRDVTFAVGVARSGIVVSARADSSGEINYSW
jgi:hypothetical protein